ncbi:MAG: hypothetical protein WBG90_20395 [Saonia sp.]
MAKFLLLLIIPFFVQSQQMFRLQLDSYQQNETSFGTMDKQLSLPVKNSVVVLGGLNDLDGIGNYLNIYGSKLIVDSSDVNSDGIRQMVLRREDGRDFFNLFPTIKAKLIPMEHPKGWEN